ncbi:Putative ribonuclease H protein At1g65750 [Linum grandiflorum]
MHPLRGDDEDSLIWGLEARGNFSIRSAYNLIAGIDPANSQSVWKAIWKWKGPNRVAHFLWLAFQSRLLTNSERSRRHMTVQMCATSVALYRKPLFMCYGIVTWPNRFGFLYWAIKLVIISLILALKIGSWRECSMLTMLSNLVWLPGFVGSTGMNVFSSKLLLLVISSAYESFIGSPGFGRQ